jgi:hypothetical protein
MSIGPRRKDEPKLMGAKEVAEELRTQVGNIRTIVGLPEPYDVIAASKLWRADEIREFAKQRRARKRTEATAARKRKAAIEKRRAAVEKARAERARLEQDAA